MVHLVGCMIPQPGHNKPPKMFPLKLRIFQGLSPEIVAAMDHIPKPSPVYRSNGAHGHDGFSRRRLGRAAAATTPGTG